MAALALIVILIVAYCLIEVRWHPWRKCPSCGGSKKNAGSNGERWGDCRRCGTSGKVRRFGARGNR